MDYKCNTCEALTLAPDHVNVLCVSYLLFKLFLIAGLKEGVNQHLKQHRVTVIDLCSVKRANLDII